ncbi:hypothetical protein [Nonlabens sp. Asnod2-A12]|uniref:hypothetical protein n=1 Tax=Nonlabens sp. Asnod2-A12 TaxID=3160578 RepID=UPI00386575E1
MPKRKKPIVLSIIELEKKGTKELLGYLTKLRRCEETLEKSDFITNPELLDDSIIYFKQTDKWKIAYHNVKVILDQRENIDRTNNKN